MKGEIDVHMETWTDNLPDYAGDLAAGKLTELGSILTTIYRAFISRVM